MPPIITAFAQSPDRGTTLIAKHGKSWAAERLAMLEVRIRVRLAERAAWLKLAQIGSEMPSGARRH